MTPTTNAPGVPPSPVVELRGVAKTYHGARVVEALKPCDLVGGLAGLAFVAASNTSDATWQVLENTYADLKIDDGSSPE